MPWFRIEDDFHGHPKVMRAGNAAVGLWIRCGTYSTQLLTDGHIPTSVARTYGRPREIAALVNSGLWAPVEDGYQMHDYHDYQPSAAEVTEKRAARAEAGRRGGVASGRTRRSKP